ncbi:MAG: hypothetical protein FWF90_03570 [Promicromonosporaceae bacterium]|nr:hypothetical protein [Promicromonosporaceae bacterium]
MRVTSVTGGEVAGVGVAGAGSTGSGSTGAGFTGTGGLRVGGAAGGRATVASRPTIRCAAVAAGWVGDVAGSDDGAAGAPTAAVPRGAACGIDTAGGLTPVTLGSATSRWTTAGFDAAGATSAIGEAAIGRPAPGGSALEASGAAARVLDGSDIGPVRGAAGTALLGT